MGGNGAYIRSINEVPVEQRTHTDTNYRVGGHKVILQSKSPKQVQIPMNFNSEKPIYLCGKVDKEGVIRVSTIAIYENHAISECIDIETDENGNFIPYDISKKKTSHSHKWFQDFNGDFGRNKHDRKNCLPIDPKYNDLINDICEFNKLRKIWNMQKEQK